jgi:hypothetical protein
MASEVRQPDQHAFRRRRRVRLTGLLGAADDVEAGPEVVLVDLRVPSVGSLVALGMSGWSSQVERTVIVGGR